MQTTYFRPSQHPDRAIHLSCRAVRVMGAGLGLPVGDLRFSPPTPIVNNSLNLCTKTNIESNVKAMYSPDKSTSKDLKGIIET